MTGKIRILFSKQGRSIYISHLDLMHTLQRGFSRAGLKIKYSQGFNPHPIMSIALPLSVGASSECEIMDISLETDTDCAALPELINPCLPEGLCVISAYLAHTKTADIKWIRHSIEIELLGDRAASELKDIRELFSRDSLIVEKKTKRGVSELDLIPGIQALDIIDRGKYLHIKAVLSAQNPTINPSMIAGAVQKYISGVDIGLTHYNREELFFESMQVFR